MFIKKFKIVSLCLILSSIVLAIVFYNRGPEVNPDYFIKNYNKMEHVISLVNNNELKIVKEFEDNNSGLMVKVLKLPFKYRSLSKDGKILCQNYDGVVSVVFVAGYYFMKEVPYGYLYKSDDLPPTPGHLSLGINRRIKECWFASDN